MQIYIFLNIVDESIFDARRHASCWYNLIMSGVSPAMEKVVGRLCEIASFLMPKVSNKTSQ